MIFRPLVRVSIHQKLSQFLPDFLTGVVELLTRGGGMSWRKLCLSYFGKSKYQPAM
jgi:hypothetical protein